MERAIRIFEILRFNLIGTIEKIDLMEFLWNSYGNENSLPEFETRLIISYENNENEFSSELDGTYIYTTYKLHKLYELFRIIILTSIFNISHVFGTS